MTVPLFKIDGPAARGAVPSVPTIRIASIAIAFGTAAMVALPLLSLARTAWQGDADIWPHLAAYVLPVAIVQTALLLAGVACVVALAGIVPAWLVTTFDFPARRALQWLLPLPLAIPTYIAAYIYADLLDAAGPVQTALRAATGWRATDYWFPQVRSLPGAIFIMGIVLYPYVYLSTRALLEAQCTTFIEAARIAGARPWRLLRSITLPLARPAIAVGIALALLETLNDIGASEYLGVQTLTLSIFTTWLNRGSLPGAAQIALAMLVVVALLIVLERYGRRGQSYQTSTQSSRAVVRIALHGNAGWLATAACAVPVALGFALPVIFLLREAITRGLLGGLNNNGLLAHLAGTVWLATLATVAVIGIGIAAAIPLRLAKLRFGPAALAVGSMGYAIPGTVLALGLMAPLVAVDEAINAVTGMFGRNVGLVLAGSSAALIVAYTVRFASISIGLVQSGLAQIPREFDDAARASGAGCGRVLRTILLPLLRPALSGAALLVFVDCLKELPLTLLLRPLNVETLSTAIYQHATRGSFEEGALEALMIVAAGIVPVVLLMRLAESGKTRSRPLMLAPAPVA